MRISDWSSDVCSSDLPGHDAVGDAGSENRKTKQRQRRQRDRHCLIGVGRLTKRGAGELAEQGRADPGNDRKRHYLDARRNDVSEYPLGHERGPAKKRERKTEEGRVGKRHVKKSK